MKTARYAVSVQYGGGHHFFRRSDLVNYQAAILLRDAEEQRVLAAWERIGRKGAKPAVFAWGRIDLPKE